MICIFSKFSFLYYNLAGEKSLSSLLPKEIQAESYLKLLHGRFTSFDKLFSCFLVKATALRNALQEVI